MGKEKLLFGDLRSSSSLDSWAHWMNELSVALKQYPAEVDLRPQMMDRRDLTDIAKVHNAKSIYDITEHIVETLVPRYGHGRAVLVCESGHPFAQLSRNSLEYAEWGIANGCVALVYGSVEKGVIWHETLHLLGATDCYNTSNPMENPGPTCELPTCIMCFAPTTSSRGSEPFYAGTATAAS